MLSLYLICDGKLEDRSTNCDAALQPARDSFGNLPVDAAALARSLRARAVECGWTFERGKVLCAFCSTNQPKDWRQKALQRPCGRAGRD